MFSAPQIRRFILSKLDKPIEKLFRMIARELPEPTKESTNKYNTHILIDMRDVVLKKIEGTSRYEAIKGLWNTLIVKYDGSDYYADLIDEILLLWIQTDWLWIEGKQSCELWRRGKAKIDPIIHKKAIAEALNKREFGKVFQLMG